MAIVYIHLFTLFSIPQFVIRYGLVSRYSLFLVPQNL